MDEINTTVWPENIWNVRYVRLRFELQLTEDVGLPTHKVSMLRGGMGQILLDVNCVHAPRGACETCGFVEECLVRRIMYTKPIIQPDRMSGVDSVGYVLECEDVRKTFHAGDTLSFRLILFGHAIVYLSQFLNAFITLGQRGIGKEHARYRIQSVMNTRGEELLSERGLQINRYQVHTLKDYILHRKRTLIEERSGKKREGFSILFRSPLCLKYENRILDHFELPALAAAAARRIYILDCLEGILTKKLDLQEHLMPKIIHETHHEIQVPRYSEHQKTKMVFHGIIGELQVGEMDEELLELLLAGELVHVGKNTSFGFGRYWIQ